MGGGGGGGVGVTFHIAWSEISRSQLKSDVSLCLTRNVPVSTLKSSFFVRSETSKPQPKSHVSLQLSGAKCTGPDLRFSFSLLARNVPIPTLKFSILSGPKRPGTNFRNMFHFVWPETSGFRYNHSDLHRS